MQEPKNETTTTAEEREAVSTDERLPYESPRMTSGKAFEQVLLMSGCNSAVFCSIPC